MKKRRLLVFLGLFIMVFAFVIIFWYYYFKDEEGVNNINKDSWALYNYGQSIKDSTGVSGVDINIIKAWELSTGSEDVVVGVVDTGVDSTSDSLSNHLWVNNAEQLDNAKDDDGNGYIDDYYGWDFYNGDATIYDDYLYDYHGTYLSNIILGVAPDVQILSSKFLKGTEGDATDSISAIQYAINNGATIINCSWCFEDEETDLYELMEANEDILFVCAAGNYRLDLDETSVYPASYELDNVISVMAIDNTGTMYNVSGYGLTVDIAAPGKNIFVTLPENDESFVSGTSVATAFVTGAAALMKSINSNLSPAEIKEILIETTQKVDTLEGLCEAEGFLDVYHALRQCK